MRQISKSAAEPAATELSFHLEELLIVLFLGGLIVLAFANDTPILEAIEKSRLTFLTALSLPFVVAVALATGRVARSTTVLRDWWQVLGALAVYESLKHLHANQITLWLGISPLDEAMLAADRLLFGEAAPILLQSFATESVVDVMWFFYVWGYYLGPATFLCWAYFYLQDDFLFLRLRKGLVLGLLGGYVLYLVFPVAGPPYTIPDQFSGPIATQPYITPQTFDGLRYNWDCFPSLHTAIPWLLVGLAWKRMSRGVRFGAVLWASGITLSTLLLRFHYGIDLIAGLAWAGIVFRIVDRSQFVFSPIRNQTFIKWMAPFRVVGPRSKGRLLGLFFVSTGVSALLAEQAFEKLLTTLIGASTPAAAIVLAVYFLGLSLGAGLYAKFAHRVARPLAVFAYLEGCVALWVIGIYLGFDGLQSFFGPVLSMEAGYPLGLATTRFLIAMLWILPPTICMGASFPAIVDALSDMHLPEGRRAVSRIYTLNLLGALLGALLGPSVAFPRWGVDGVLLFAALLDGMVFFGALRLATEVSGRGRGKGLSQRTSISASAGLLLLCAIAFASGAVFFSLEVIWTHLLGAVVGNSVYVFAGMLALVLAGLLIGGTAISLLFADREHISPAYVGAVFLFAAALMAIQHLHWPGVPSYFSDEGVLIDSFLAGELLRWRVAATQILPTAVVMGMAYPLLFRLRLFSLENPAEYAGWVSVANTAGCIFGALVTSFFLIPKLGSETSLVLVAVVSAACGTAIVFFDVPRLLRYGIVGAAIMIVSTLVFMPPWDRLELTSGEHVYFRRNQVWPESRLEMFHEDTHGGVTTVVSNRVGHKVGGGSYLTLLTNGKFQGNDAWEMEAQTGFTLIPGLFSSGFRHACLIGLGTGRSALVAKAMGFGQIDIAELSPGIVQAARQYFPHVNGEILADEKVRVWLEDGRNLLLVNEKWRCDLISMEITSIWFAGATSLYSKEFYALAKSRLAEGGVLQQWVQLHHIGKDELGAILATVSREFQHVGLWVFGGQGVIVASQNPLIYSRAAEKQFLCGAHLLGLNAPDAQALIGAAKQSLLLDPQSLRELVGSSRRFVINTDRNRYLEYATPRYNASKLDHKNLNLQWLGRFSRGKRVDEMEELREAGAGGAQTGESFAECQRS